VFRYGVDRFLADAKRAGFDGLILPDLPPPEAQNVCQKVWDAGLDTTLLVAPTTSADRRAEIARLCSGFIYYLSVAGVTGERKTLPPDLVAGLGQMRQLTDQPLCVGFGISTAEHVSQLKGHADGAIVGTAVVRRMKQSAHAGPDVIAEIIETYCKELLGR
jgi:tryptophan synthase alpha chain